MVVHLTTEEVRAWLLSLGEDRNWLAHQLGTSKRTIDNWFTDSSLPLWAQCSIRNLMALNNPAVINPRMTQTEWRTVESAARALGFPSTDEFILAAILEKASTYQPAPIPAERAADSPDTPHRPRLKDPGA